MLEMNTNEMQLLNRFNMLNRENQREMEDYLRYLLFKQYKAELNQQVFGNPILLSLLTQAERMCERDETVLEEVQAKVEQAQYVFCQILERVSAKYEEIINEPGSDQYVRDWGRLGFQGVAEALEMGCRDRLKNQIEEMLHGYHRLAKKEDRILTVAV